MIRLLTALLNLTGVIIFALLVYAAYDAFKDFDVNTIINALPELPTRNPGDY